MGGADTPPTPCVAVLWTAGAQAEIKQMEDLLRQRVATFGELSETAARVEALADKVTTQTTAKEDQALAAANAHRPRHQRLKLMDTTRNKDGTFERPKAEPEPEMDAETAALFEEVEFKQKQIEDAVDGITKQVRRAVLGKPWRWGGAMVWGVFVKC